MERRRARAVRCRQVAQLRSFATPRRSSTIVESAPDYRLFRKAIDQARSRDVPGLVLAEVDYFLRDESQRPGQVLKFTVHASAARSRIRREE